jgi:hypothetical protein
MIGPFGSELAKIRASSLREDAANARPGRPARHRVALGRLVVGAGARLMGACGVDLLAALDGRR